MTQSSGRGTAAACLFALVLAGKPSTAETSESPAPRARTHQVVGELARLDLVRRVLVVRVQPAEGSAYDLEVETDDGTRVSSRGRVLAFSELRPGERIVVSCRDEAQKHRAVVVRMDPARKSPALPAASPAGS